MASRISGTVKWFNNPKGYGFINSLNGDEQDIFVHYSSIVSKEGEYKTLKPLDPVTFILGSGPRGPYALAVVSDSRASELTEELKLMENQQATPQQTGAAPGRVKEKDEVTA